MVLLLLLLLGDDSGTTAIAKPTLASAELIVNEVPRGDAFVMLRDGSLWVPIGTLHAAGLRINGGARVIAPDPTGPQGEDRSEFVSLASLAPALTYTWDEADVQLRITAHSEQFERQLIAVRSAAPADLVRPRNSSLFVNYSAFAESGGTTLATDAGVSLRGVLVRAGGGRDATGRFWRAPSHITIDDSTRLVRWDAGDSVVSGGLVAGARPIVGVSVSREFGIDPYFVRYTPLALSGAATTPSVAEIYVNGQLVRRERIAPGAFTLSGLPPTVGAGEATVVLRDAFGREQRLASSFYEPASLLAPGLQEFHYAAGVQRDESRLWRYNGVVAAATHRVGVSERVTLGINADLAPRVMTIEPTMAARAPVGEIEMTLAAARVAERVGTAWLAAWSYHGRALSGGVSARHQSEELRPESPQSDELRPDAAGVTTITPLGLGLTAPRSEIDVRAGWTFGRGVSVSASQTYGHDWQEQRLARQTLNIIMPLTLRTNAAGTWTRVSSAGIVRQEAFVGIMLRLGTKSSATVASRRLGDRQTAQVSYQRSMPVGPGYGARVEWSGETRDVDASLQAQGQYGRVEVRRELFGGLASGGQGQGSRAMPSVGVSGALVAVGGHLFATRPVDDAFAVIKVAEVSGVRAYASNQFVGRTNDRGEVVVPNLVSYYGNRLSIDPEDVPLTHDVRAHEYAIAPALRAGALVRFDTPAVRPITGRLFIVDQPARLRVVPAFGEARVDEGGQREISPVGGRGEFFFERLDPGRHHVRVLIDGREYGCELTVPDARDASGRPVDLGEIICTGPLLEAGAQP